MAATQTPPKPLEVPESLEDLSLRIHAMELRVVRRDLEFNQHWESLQHRGRAVLQPSRFLMPIAGTVGGWVFWKLFKRRPPKWASRSRPARHERHERGAHHERHAAAHQGPPKPPEKKPDVATLQMLTMAWGLMPDQIRGKLGPELTQLMLGLAAGIMQGLKQRKPKPEEESTAR